MQVDFTVGIVMHVIVRKGQGQFTYYVRAVYFTSRSVAVHVLRFIFAGCYYLM